MQRVLSIIIPCYNSEKFISSTLDMLIEQGLEGCEVIIINDGSKDNTSMIIHSYENRIQNCIIIDKENEGVSIARNIGIQKAQGKFIYFLDSDDSLTIFEPSDIEYSQKKTSLKNPINIVIYIYVTNVNKTNQNSQNKKSKK